MDESYVYFIFFSNDLQMFQQLCMYSENIVKMFFCLVIGLVVQLLMLVLINNNMLILNFSFIQIGFDYLFLVVNIVIKDVK